MAQSEDNKLDRSNLPEHVAIIMDGNGRWAKTHGQPRVEGHRVGSEVSEEIINHAVNLGIRYLTLYAFSKENWNRPKAEVDALMLLLREFLISKKQKMINEQIRFNTIGSIELLPDIVQDAIREVKEATAQSTGLVLTMALSYGARDEILRAIKKMMLQKVDPCALTDEVMAEYLDTQDMPDPDLIIRTSGELRMSNFLLWQGAYAEYVFESCNWPDFTIEKFESALREFQNRDRRFGRVRLGEGI